MAIKLLGGLKGHRPDVETFRFDIKELSHKVCSIFRLYHFHKPSSLRLCRHVDSAQKSLDPIFLTQIVAKIFGTICFLDHNATIPVSLPARWAGMGEDEFRRQDTKVFF
jgi:hypothetical protein